MAINFPDSPTINDTHTANNRTWIWTGTVWNLVGTIGPAGPVNDYVENITGGTGVSVSGTPGTAWTPTVSIGQDVATSSSPTFANITLTGNISVSGTVDGRDIAADGVKLDALDAAVVLQGSWDASAGTFPGGGTAQAGYTYIVSVAGTVDSVDFNVNDRVLAIVDNASTSTYASNWLKLDYTDQVLSVNSQTGAVVLDADDIDDTSTTNKFVTAADLTTISNALTTSTSFGGDVSGTYDNIQIDNDSHTHDANNLTGTTLASAVVSSSLTSVGTLSSLNIAGDLTVDTSTLFVDSTNNRVGVGTVTPSTAFEIIGSGFRVQGTGATAGGILSITPNTSNFVDLTGSYLRIEGSNYLSLTGRSLELSAGPTIGHAILNLKTSNGTGIHISGSNTNRRIAIGNNNTTTLTSQAVIYSSSASYNALVLRGATSQSVNIQEWQDSTGTILASMSSAGNFSAAAVELTDGTSFAASSVVTATTSTTVSQTIDSSAADSVKYVVYVSDGTDRQVTELLAVQDGVDVFYVQYANVVSGSSELSSFDVSYSAGSIVLAATPAVANLTFKIHKVSIS